MSGNAAYGSVSCPAYEIRLGYCCVTRPSRLRTHHGNQKMTVEAMQVAENKVAHLPFAQQHGDRTALSVAHGMALRI